MTNSPVPSVSTSTRVNLPSLASGLFITAVVLLPIGGFLATVHGDSTLDFAILQTRLGVVGFWIGVGLVLTGLVLVGVRSIAQQQVDILLKLKRD